MNIDTLNNNRASNDYKDLITSYGFANFIDRPTYVSPATNKPISCVDHIVSNISIPCSSYVLQPNISDHFAVSSIFNKKLDDKPINIKFRDFSEENKVKFSNNLDREFSSFDPPRHDVDLFAEYLKMFLLLLLLIRHIGVVL